MGRRREQADRHPRRWRQDESIIRIAGGVGEEEDGVGGRAEVEEGGVKQRKQREQQQHLQSLCPSCIIR